MASNPASFGLTPEEEAFLFGQPQGLLGQAQPAPDDYFAQPTPQFAGIDTPPDQSNPLATQPSLLDPQAEDDTDTGIDTSKPYYQPKQDDAPKKVIDLSKHGEPEDAAKPKLVIDLKGLPMRSDYGPDTADVGSIAAAHTAADKAIADQPGTNVEFKASEVTTYGQQLHDLINSSEHWNDTPQQFAQAARDLATQMGDPRLASKFIPLGGWAKLSEYRKDPNARPSDIRFAGKKTDKTEADQQREVGVPFLKENTSTARMKAGFREGGFAGLQAAEEILGVDSSHADARRRYYHAVTELAGPGLQASDVHSFRDALTLVAQQSVEQSPYLAASIAGGEIGSVLGGSVGAYLGAFGSSYGMELGQVEEGTKEIDPKAKAGWRTMIAAGGAAALDSIVPAGIGKALVARVGQEEADRIAWQLLFADKGSKIGQTLIAVGKNVGKAGGEEALTEGAQQFVEAVGGSWEGSPDHRIEVPDDILQQMGNAAVGGFVLGGTTGAAAHAGQTAAHGQNMLGEMADAQFNTDPAQIAAQRFSPSPGDVAAVPNTSSMPTSGLPKALPIVVPLPKGAQPRTVAPTTVPVSRRGEPQSPLIPKGTITSKFGPRHTFRTANGNMASSNHAGNDIVLPGGKLAKIPAAVDGVVTFAGKRGGYGNYVVITASDGTSFAYGHLSAIGVKKGDQVSQGETLGRQGATGNATGVHLHFERRDAQGRVVDSMTARPVRTEFTQKDDGDYELHDDTPHPTKQEPFEEENDAPFPKEEIDSAFEEATGQRFAENGEGSEGLSTPSEPSVSDLTEGQGATPVSRPAADTLASADQLVSQHRAHPGATVEQDTSSNGRRPMAEVVGHALGSSQAPNVDAIASEAMASLDERKAQNPATAKLHEIEQQAIPAGHDYTQPLPGEEPVFDETQSQVLGFHHPETGAVRAIGEAPGENVVAGFGSESPATTPVATTSSRRFQLDDADQTEQLTEAGNPRFVMSQPSQGGTMADLAAEQGKRPLVIHPDVPLSEAEAAPFDADAVARRHLGPEQQAMLDEAAQARQTPVEAQQAPEAVGQPASEIASPDASGAASERYAANNERLATEMEGWADQIDRHIAGKKDGDMVRLPVGDASPERVSDLRKQAARYRADAASLRAENAAPDAPASDLEAITDRIHDKLFDLENDGTKSKAVAYARSLVKKGILDQADVDALAHIVKDRDMGVEDVTSEIRTSVELWEERQRQPSGRAKMRVGEGPRVVQTRYGAITEPAADDFSFAARIARQRIEEADRAGTEQGRSETDGERGAEGPALERPPVEADGTVVLDHYSTESELSSTDPNYFGKSGAFSKQERAYLRDAPPRTYFGIAAGHNGGYKNEFVGRTHFQARVKAERLYDVAADPDNLWVRGQPAESEWAIKNAGYAGYWHKNSQLGLVAIVFDAQQVTKVAKPKAQLSSREIGQQRSAARAELNAIKQSTLNKVHAIYREMGLQGLVPVDIVTRIITHSGEASRGTYTPETHLIRIAAFDGYNPVSDFDLRQTARHEVVHWALENGVWTGPEWKLLKKWAASQPGIMAWAKENYPLSADFTVEDQLEEAVAEGFARWDSGQLEAQGKAPDTIIGRILQKLKTVVSTLRQAFRSAGITDEEFRQATQLLAEFENGKHMAKLRKVKDQRPSFGRNARKDSLSYELLTGSITPDQHWFLSRFKGDQKFQSAWHGSPAENIDKFSLNYIGQGEGAQAFGWGLYFAQRKDVADWYRRKLTSTTNEPVDKLVRVNGEPLRNWVHNNVGPGYHIAAYEVADRLFDFLSTNKPYNGWVDAIHARFDNDMADYIDAANKAGNPADVEQLKRDAADVGRIFSVLANQNVSQKLQGEGGKLYAVEVPENHQLLDQDKPLGEQSEQVKAALAKLKAHLEKADVLDEYEEQMNASFEEWTGRELVSKILKRLAYDDAYPAETSDALESALEAGHAAMAASIYLRDLGIPGSRYLDRDSRTMVPGEPATANFVIFDDDLITLKAKYRVVNGTPANSPLADPSKPDPGMFQRMHDATMGLLTKVGNLAAKEGERTDWDSADRAIDAWRRKLVNKYQQIIKTQKRAEKLSGVDRMAADANPMDLITADERGYKLNVLTDTMIKPMLRELHTRGIALSDLGLYLYARHAPHRNARIAKINKEFRAPDKPGSGMTDDEAANIMANFAAAGKLGDLAVAAQHIDNMIAYAQQERLAAGLLTPADVAKGFAPGEFYVPLRGHSEAEPEFEIDMPFSGGRKGGGFSVSGKEGHRMFGRESMADLEEIVGYSITQAQDAIDRAFRNRVAQAMANMFRSVPDSNFVRIDRVQRVAVWNKKTGQVEYQMQTRITDPLEQQRTIFFKENGVVHKMTFNQHNMSALRFVKAAKNLGITEIGRTLRVMSLYTRLFTKANTQWNLDFVLANAVKDIQTATVNASTLDVKGLRRAILKNVFSLGALRGAWWGVTHNAGDGFGTGKKWQEAYAEFEANGGKLDYGQTGPVDDAIRRAKREMKNLKRLPISPIKAVQTVGGWIDTASSAFENMTRLAAYKALRDAGIPPKQAAVAVRELTTNFQQHGEWGPKINAAYGFANATMIGGARFTSTVIKKPQVAGAIIAAGMLADWLSAWMQPDRWDRYDEETKDRDFMILLPEWMGFDIHLPAGYGINTMATAGRKMSELWRGKKNADGSKMSVLDAAADVGHSLVNSFSPVPGHSFLNILSPTALDPFVDLIQNEDNWGHRIYPQGSDRPGQTKPNSQLVRDQTSEFWRGMAEGMNRLGGGNEVVPGIAALDHSPESYKYLAAQIGGGAARTVGRAVGLVEDAVTGEKPALNDVPVVRRFAGRPYGAAGAADEAVSVFYDHYNTGIETLGNAKRMVERYGHDSKEYQDWKADHAQVIGFHKNIEAAEKRVNAYSAAENAIRRGRDAANGLDKEKRRAIYKVTGIPVPQRKLTKEEAERMMAAVKVKRQKLAEAFNNDWRKTVMGEVE